MFAALKSKNLYEQPAAQIYTQIMMLIRREEFYAGYGVPDTIDGRFDLLLLHIFLVLQQVLNAGGQAAEDFNQALFDTVFADMDQSLREVGIGDMGIPKHMRKMMKAFNGRMHAYQEAFEKENLRDALRNNLYGTLEQLDDDTLANMEQYVLKTADALKKQGSEALLTGELGVK